MSEKSVLQRLFTETWPAKAAQSAIHALMLPGQVAGGELAVQPSQPGMWSDVDEAKSQANAQTMRERATDLAGLVMGGSYAAPAMKNATGMGIRAYHGSPHDYPAERLVRAPSGAEQYIVGRPDALPDIPFGYQLVRDFPLGRMRSDKIGTGEGAQAYGHGNYLAEAEPTAWSYRFINAPSYFRNGADSWARSAANAAESAGLSGDEAKRYALDTLNKRAMDLPVSGRQPLFDAMNNYETLTGNPATPGRMYEVNINARPEQFLDWDKPLKGQTVQQNVVSAVRPEMRGRVAEEIDDGLLGQGALSYLNTIRPVGGGYRSVLDPATQSKALLDSGIPGIKYLDQGSRGAGQGSSNYVVFDDKLIDILRKYGLAGGSVLSALFSQGNEAQAAP